MLIPIIIMFIIFFFLKKRKETFTNKKFKYGIVICCFNRPNYVKQTFESLKQSKLNNCLICIVDDYSSDHDTQKLIEDFNIDKSKNVKIVKIRNEKNLGIKKSLLIGFNKVFDKCEYLTNIDSDVIMKPNWLNILEKTHDIFNKSNIVNNGVIVSGFNCVNSCGHKIKEGYDKFNIKNSLGGINMFYTKKIFINLIKPILEEFKENGSTWDWEVCARAQRSNVKLITTKPSAIQHIGAEGMWSKKNNYDYAEDF